MRWVAYVSPTGDERIGLVLGDSVHGLERPHRLLALLGDDGEALSAAAERAASDPLEVVALGDVGLLAPITTPPSIRDFMSFEEHVRNASGRVHPGWYEVPVFYFTNPAAVHGPRDDVAIAPGSNEFDYELEFAAVIGRPGSDLSPAHAADHIAGYMLLCDWSARDLQRVETSVQPSLGPVKGKDSATSFGPYFVTADELTTAGVRGQPSVGVTASVNDRLYTQADTADGYWSFGQMIAYASRGTRVVPGDVIGSGTVGTGCLLELRTINPPAQYPWLVAGDVVTLEGGPLGTIESRIVQGTPKVDLR